MKREFLKGLGLEADAIDKIMDEHGKTVTANKDAAEEAQKQLAKDLKTAQADLATAKSETGTKVKEVQDKLDEALKSLKSFDGVDVEDLKTRLTTAETTVETLTSEHTSKVAALEADVLLREHLAGLTFSSAYAKKGIYEDLKAKVKYEEGQLVGLDETLEELRKTEPAAFASAPQNLPPKDEGKEHGAGGKSTGPKPVPIII